MTALGWIERLLTAFGGANLLCTSRRQALHECERRRRALHSGMQPCDCLTADCLRTRQDKKPFWSKAVYPTPLISALPRWASLAFKGFSVAVMTVGTTLSPYAWPSVGSGPMHHPPLGYVRNSSVVGFFPTSRGSDRPGPRRQAWPVPKAGQATPPSVYEN